MNKSKILIAAALALASANASAQNIDRLQLLTGAQAQSDFKLLSEDLGGALSYRPQIHTTPLGITGFDVGVSFSAVKLGNVDVLKKVSSSSNVPATLPIPTLRAHKGLPFGFDIGLAQTPSIPNSNIKITSGELRYALISGGIAVPAVGLRISGSKLSGVDQLAMTTKGVDLSVSKGFLMFTPYGGVGRIQATSTPNGIPLLKAEDVSMNKVFAGVTAKFLLLAVNLEGDKTGSTTAYSLKLGLQF